MSKPDSSQYSEFYQPYLDVIPEEDTGLIELLSSSRDACLDRYQNLDSGKEDFRYAEGKWSIKELLQHIIDAERVFAYRALRFARNDSTELSGFDENLYVETCRVAGRSLASLMEEFSALRNSNILLFDSMDEDVLSRKGSVDGNGISVRALGYITCGHLLHHLKVIEERYL